MFINGLIRRIAIQACLCIFFLLRLELSIFGSEIQDRIDGLEAISSLELEATVQVHVYEAFEAVNPEHLGESIDGVYSCAHKDQLWRISSWLDPSTYKGINVDIAFDGGMLQYFDYDSKLLSLSTSLGPECSAPVLPNPIFELGQFLRPRTDDNAMLCPRLADMREAAAAFDLGEACWESVSIDGLRAERLELPGGRYEAQDYTHVIYSTSGERGQPFRIDRIGTQGEVLTRSIFNDYQPADSRDGTQLWPRRVRFEVFEEGERVMMMEYTITRLVVNPQPELSVQAFRIGWADARSVAIDGVVLYTR